jgi:WD40 repeat protein
VADGALASSLVGHDSFVQVVAFSPDGTMLATGSWDNNVGLFRVSDGSLLRMLEGHVNEVFGVAFSPDGALLATGSKDGIIMVWGRQE